MGKIRILLADCHQAVLQRVAHHVEVSLFANCLGTAQLRYYQLEGDRLILRTPPILCGDCVVVAQLTWRRIGSGSYQANGDGGKPTWLL